MRGVDGCGVWGSQSRAALTVLLKLGRCRYVPVRALLSREGPIGLQDGRDSDPQDLASLEIAGFGADLSVSAATSLASMSCVELPGCKW